MVINLSINKNSLFFKISIFFSILIITVHAIIYLGYNITKQQQIDLLVTKYMKTQMKVAKDLRDLYPLKAKHFLPPPPKAKEFKDEHFKSEFPPPPPPPLLLSNLDKDTVNNELNKYDLELSTISYNLIKTEGKLLASEHNWELYEYKGFKYFYNEIPHDFILIKDILKLEDRTQYLILLTILVNITFILFYIYLIQKLRPLQQLRKNIMKFSEGDLSINTSCNGNDEISEVSNEFNNALNEIRQLNESRNLFLRNIMHELKTPITKGSLISDIMVQNKYQENLKRVFSRLEYLLHEFAKIEQLTSKNIELQKDNYRVIDIIDQAIDILFIEREKVTINVQENLIINVDFQLFSLALKNLIDNGIKYGKSTVVIDITKNTIFISTKGERLHKDFEEYLKPFNREYETSNKSLGLGLYIVNNILKAHDLSLEYKYEKNQNIFYINF